MFRKENKGNVENLEHKFDSIDNTPLRQRPYKTDMKSQEIIDATVEELLKDGIISEWDSEWALPVIIVQKKMGETRLCVDYRKVNKVLRRDEWPFPRINDILDTLGNCKVFSVLDLNAGFHQIKMENKSKCCSRTRFCCVKTKINRLPFYVDYWFLFFECTWDCLTSCT